MEIEWNPSNFNGLDPGIFPIIIGVFDSGNEKEASGESVGKVEDRILKHFQNNGAGDFLDNKNIVNDIGNR